MENEKIQKLIKFYLLATSLKDRIRSGWNKWNIDRQRVESVAEHIYGTCILAIAIDSEFNLNIDIYKVVMMMVLHEIEEVKIGDLTPFDKITAEEKRIIVVGTEGKDVRYNAQEEIPITAMINPSWKKLSEDTDIQYEGCMSVPVLRGRVERYTKIELTYYTETGEKVVKEIDNFFARLIQHECDHLDGIVFLERVKEHNGFATLENVNKYNLRQQ